MRRNAIAALILAFWIAGLGVMLRRSFGGDVNRRLTEAAIRIQPATFYYALSYRGAKIGAASSAIDTLVGAVVSEEYYTGRFPSGDSLIPVSARLHSTMTRGLRLTNISMQLDRGTQREKMTAFVQEDTTLVVVNRGGSDSTGPHMIGLHGPLLPPGLVGVALLVGEQPRTGLSQRFIVFNPTNAKPERREVRVTSDSLFTVVDSAARTSAGMWQAAHSDTVRGWKLGGNTSGLAVWVDVEGRVVQVGAPDGLLLTRTAFELAFERGAAR